MPRFVYVATGNPGKSLIKDSPSYGKVPVPKVERMGIMVLQVEAHGPGLSLVDILELSGCVDWIEKHPFNGHVYASWEDQVGAFSVGGDGRLTMVNTARSIGGVHHMTVSADGAWLLTAGYMSKALMVFPIAANGSLRPASDSKLHQAPMIERLADRQEQCHPHQIMFNHVSPGWALACDLGADCVWVYAFCAQQGALIGALGSDRHAKFPEGSGPRHLAVHPSGSWVFVLCELDSNLVTCSWDAAAGRLTPKSSAYVLPEGKPGCRAHHSGASAIRTSPDGRRVYASHRTDDTIVVFDVDGGTGALRRLQGVSCAGVTPRDLQLEWPVGGGDDTAGRYLRVVNSDTQAMATFALGADGLLVEPPSICATTGLCPVALTQAISPPPWVADLLPGQKRSLAP